MNAITMDADRASLRRGLPRWAWIVAAMLVTHTTLMITIATIAVDDPSFTTVPDYYERALAWDELRERRQESDRLGWEVDIAPSALGDRLVVTLLDRDGVPVVGASGDLSLYHHAGARDVRTVELVERGDGVYFATVDVSRVGAWQVTLVAQRHTGEDYFDEREVVVQRPGAAS